MVFSKVETGLHVLLVLVLVFMISGCGSDREKRHLLKDEIKDVKKSQEKAEDEFKDALTRIKELYDYKDGNLEEYYEKLKQSYDDCNNRSVEIEKRILVVTKIADAHFLEWKMELKEIKDPELRNKSKSSLSTTRLKFKKLEKTLNDVAKRMHPILAKLNDYVLYLKHNLNAKAVADSLGGQIMSIETDIIKLIEEMNKSIRETEIFIKDF